MRRRLPLAGTLAALALAAVACGDDRMSASEYRAEARKVCIEGGRSTAAIEQPTRATPEAITAYFRAVLRANQRSSDRFRALEPPEELQQAHDDALAVNDAAADELRRVVRELDQGADPQEALSVARTRLLDLSRRSGDAARRLGVPECADS